MTRGGRVGRGRITDSGLVPRRTRLYRFFVPLSPRAAEYDGACLVELFSCLLSSSSIWASRLLSLSSHRSFVCERRPLQSTKSHSLSAMLRWYLYWTDIETMILTIYKISWRIVKYVLKVSGVFPKGRKRDNKRSSVSLFFRLSAWPVPSLRFCNLQQKKHCVQKYGNMVQI